MRIPIDQITAVAKRLDYAEVVTALNERLGHGGSGLRAAEHVGVGLSYYRAGLDIVVEGSARGVVEATCGRCLEDYDLPTDVAFRVVLTPRVEESLRGGEIEADDVGIGVLDGDAVDVTAIVHEQLLLAVPTTRLCRPTCRGLCPGCGTNLNEGSCDCDPAGPRPRLAVLHDVLAARTPHD